MQNMAVAGGKYYPIRFILDGNGIIKIGKDATDFEVRFVDIVFNGASTRVRVSIPRGLGDDRLTQIPFHVHKKGCDSTKLQLRIKAEQFENILLKVALFNKTASLEEPTPEILMDIPVEPPVGLDPYGTYNLYVDSSDGLFLTAEIVKHGDWTKAQYNLISNTAKLFRNRKS